MTITDTDQATHAVQLGLLRSRSPEQRLGMALQLSDDLLALRCAGIRARHPEYGEAEVEWALRRLVHGHHLFRCAWPAAPCLEP